MRPKKIDYILATDGSCRVSRVTGRNYSSYAGVLVNIERRMKTTYSGLVNGYGINYAEGEALYVGLSTLAYKLDGRDANILVVTDSKLTIAVVNAYIPYLWHTEGDLWTTSSGKPVKNQELYKMLKSLMMSHTNLHVKLVHVKSHVDISSEWRRSSESLRRWKVETSGEMVKFILGLNATADMMARRESELSMKREENTRRLALRIVPKGGIVL